MAHIRLLRLRWLDVNPVFESSGTRIYSPEVIGLVVYEVRRQDARGEDHFEYFHQPFMRAPAGQKNFLVVLGRKEPIWSWDGNRERPSLTPSYEIHVKRDGRSLPSLHVHIHLTEGRIVVSDDAPDVVAEI